MVELFIIQQSGTSEYTRDSLDLFSSQLVTITKQSNDIGELQNRQVDFTRAFDIPRTNRNHEILGPLEVNTVNDRPYRYMKCDLLYNGLPVVADGVMLINRVNFNTINVTVYQSVFDFFEKLRLNESLRDLDLSDYPMDYTSANVEAKLKDGGVDGVVWCLLDNGQFTEDENSFFDPYQEGTRYYRNILRPCFKASYLLEKIFTKQGLTLDNQLIGDPVFDSLMICGDGTEDKGDINREIIDVTIIDPTLENPDVTYDYRVVKPFESYTLNMDCALYPFAYAVYGRKTGSQASFKLAGGNSINVNGVNTVEVIINTGDHDSVRLEVYQTDVTTYTSGLDSIKYFETGKYYSIDKGERFYNYNTVAPDVSQKDFVKDILNMFGAVFTQEGGTFKIFKFNDITNNEIVNWSDKVNFANIKEIEYRFGDYGQTNYLSYDDENLQRGIFFIDDSKLEQEKEVIEIKGSPVNLLLFVDFFIGRTNSFKIGVESNGVSRYVTGRNKGTRYCLLDFNSFSDTNVDIQLVSRVTATGSVVNAIPITTSPDTFNIAINNESLSAQTLVNNYYGLYSTMLNDVKVLRAEVVLNAYDVMNFKYFHPVYLEIPEEEVQGLFYVNKIENWTEDKIATVEFIKLD